MTDALAPFPLPERGLGEVLSAWTGEGAVDEFFRTLGIIAAAGEGPEPLAERAWLEERAARERANRVLVGRLRPELERLPTTGQTWINALPAESRTSRIVSDRPMGSVDWVRTSQRGWPPIEFHLKRRHRTDDSVLARVVGWVVEALLTSISDTTKLAPSLLGPVEKQVAALTALIDHPLIAEAPARRPSVQEIRAVRGLGRPWVALVPIAEYYSRLNDVSSLASELIVPDAELAWRLFHLGCLGEVLVQLRDEGCDLTAAAPLYGGSSNPAYISLVPDGSRVDVWFEASGCWKYYAPDLDDPYRRAAASASRAAALSPDILLVRSFPNGSSRGLVLECKSGADAAAAARDGYLQVVAYAAQLRAMTGMPVEAWVLGRDDLFGLPTAGVLEAAGIDAVGMVAGSRVSDVTSLWLAETTTPSTST